MGPRTLLDGYKKEKFFISSRVLVQISQPYRIVVLSLSIIHFGQDFHTHTHTHTHSQKTHIHLINIHYRHLFCRHETKNYVILMRRWIIQKSIFRNAVGKHPRSIYLPTAHNARRVNNHDVTGWTVLYELSDSSVLHNHAENFVGVKLVRLFTHVYIFSVNPSAWGHLNPSSHCDVGRLFYGVFKLWSKLQRKKMKK